MLLCLKMSYFFWKNCLEQIRFSSMFSFNHIHSKIQLLEKNTIKYFVLFENKWLYVCYIVFKYFNMTCFWTMFGMSKVLISVVKVHESCPNFPVKIPFVLESKRAWHFEWKSCKIFIDKILFCFHSFKVWT